MKTLLIIVLTVLCLYIIGVLVQANQKKCAGQCKRDPECYDMCQERNYCPALVR